MAKQLTAAQAVQKLFEIGNRLARVYGQSAINYQKLIQCYADLIQSHRAGYVHHEDPRWFVLNSLIAKHPPPGRDGVFMRNKIKQLAKEKYQNTPIFQLNQIVNPDTNWTIDDLRGSVTNLQKEEGS